MKTTLESKRKELNQAISQRSSLTDKMILRISQELDQLVNIEQKKSIKTY